MKPGDRVRLKRDVWSNYGSWTANLQGDIILGPDALGRFTVLAGDTNWIGPPAAFECIGNCSPTDKHVQCRHCGIALVDCEYHR